MSKRKTAEEREEEAMQKWFRGSANSLIASADDCIARASTGVGIKFTLKARATLLEQAANLMRAAASISSHVANE